MFCRLIALAVALACVGAAVLLLLPHEVHQQLRSHIVLPKVVTLDGALLDERFTAWSQAWSKTYATSEERASRLRNFAVTLAQVEAHNARSDVSWQMGLNEFSDWTDDEFMAYFNLGAMQGQQECSATKQEKPKTTVALDDPPERIDWREQGIVSPVKNQGHCGSCWTFSSTGALEAHYKKKTGRLVSLSEQQLLDCAGNYDNHGCNGGLPSHAFEYVKENGGIDSEAVYPYKAASPDGTRCKFHKLFAAVQVMDVVNITQFDEKQLERAVGTVGPVSVAFQVASDFRSYAGGVYTSTVCGNQPKDVNHAVLAVGYDTDAATKKKYWIIKNSWGSAWGLEGYFLMERGKNMCGVSDCASYPVL